MTAVFTTLIVLNLAGQEPLLPSIIAGVSGMMGILVVNDETRKEKQVTTLLLIVSAASGVTIGSLLSGSAVLVGAFMILVIFSAFYFSKFGSRYFSLGMIGFITVYFSSFLQLSPSQFPWFYLGIVIGVSCAFLYNFIIFKDSVQILKRSMQSFHKQANLTFQLFIETIEDPEIKEARQKKLAYNVEKLRDYARNVSEDLNAQDIRELWPGLRPQQLRLYVFDTAMFMETLADSLRKLKQDEALEMKEIRTLLVNVMASLKKADVLDQDYEEQSLDEARAIVSSLHELIDDLFRENHQQPDGWLYLLRRIEAIADHVIKGAQEVQFSIYQREEWEEDEPEDTPDEEEQESTGLKPTTKKALQSVIAGTIAIILGYLISPIQPYWILLTTFIVLLGTETVGRTYLKGLERSIGTIIGAVVGFVLAQFVSGYAVVEVGLIFLAIFFAFYLLTVSYTMMSLFITMLIAFMYDLILGGISYELLGARVVDTIAGAAIALGVSAYIYPTKTMDKVTETFIDYLDDLDEYVLQYMKSFHKDVSVKDLAEKAFILDGKLQSLREDAKPVLNGPGVKKYSGLTSWLTIFIAINYYAKHLVASSYQKNFHYPDEVGSLFQVVEEKFSHNIEVLSNRIESNDHSSLLYDLSEEREAIEQFKADQENGDLVHHLYYVWKINKSLLVFGEQLGLERKR
ncbi:FUSC family protein [Halobacillus fulvus]|nr:FUSC family protein [Halobacillus fulvus]